MFAPFHTLICHIWLLGHAGISAPAHSARRRVQAGQEGGGAVQRQGLSLLTAAVKTGASDEAAALRFAFRVVSPAGTLCLQAGSEAEQRGWMAALQARTPQRRTSAGLAHACSARLVSEPS